MSQQTATPSPSVAAQQVGASSKVKKTNKQRADARSKFDSSAASLPVEKFFNGFNEIRRNNVDVVYDAEFVDRVSEIYVSKAHTYATTQLNVPEARIHDLPAKAHALVSLTVARKLLLSVPQSEDMEMSRFKFIRDVELMAPKALISLVDNLGKFEEDKFRGRLRYGNLDIFRILVRMCQIMDMHSEYHDRYFVPLPADAADHDWEAVNTDNLLNVSESSVRWLRDRAVSFLDRAYGVTWEVTYQPPVLDPDNPPAAVQMQVSYPRLQISDNYATQVANVAAWLPRLHEQMPGIGMIVAAGLCTIWKLMWLQRLHDPFERMGERFPARINAMTPIQILLSLEMRVVETGVFDDAEQTWISMVKDIHRDISSDQAQFGRFLDLAKQPDNKFGTVAMMFPYKEGDYVSNPIIGLPINVDRIRHGAQSRVVIPWANKGQVVSGLISGFSTSVSLNEGFTAQVNGNPATLLSQYLKSDIKFHNF